VQIYSVIESAIYVHDLSATQDFYHRILGLPIIAQHEGRHVFFQAGAQSVLLAFVPEPTLRGDTLPAHGARGPGHFALGIDRLSLDAWRTHLQTHDIVIEQEVSWPQGGRSLYFRDPAGNLVELVTPGIWGLPSGW
jgi:catechol 2,3-dioxygenase-like lactoylglutathione lyase family enzyme